jgi:tRNA A37 methylthiotransferase MiaB
MLALGQRRALFGLLNNLSLRILSRSPTELANTTAISSFSSSSFFAASAAHSSSSTATSTTIPNDGLTLNHFIKNAATNINFTTTSTLPTTTIATIATTNENNQASVFIETYGCQMNMNDTEVINAVLQNVGYSFASSAETADIVLINTCAIRDNAESKIWQRLGYYKNMKLERRNTGKRQRAAASTTHMAASLRNNNSINGDATLLSINNSYISSPTKNNSELYSKNELVSGPVVGVLGCMAERLKIKLLESDRLVDLVAGPDAYRDLQRLIHIVDGGVSSEKARKSRKIVNTSSSSSAKNAKKKVSTTTAVDEHAEEDENDLSDSQSPFNAAINVQLSIDETYADVIPVRPAGAHSVFLSIMRGCNNMCSFCVVPFTRGRERSRPMQSIVDEVSFQRGKNLMKIVKF